MAFTPEELEKIKQFKAQKAKEVVVEPANQAVEKKIEPSRFEKFQEFMKKKQETKEPTQYERVKKLAQTRGKTNKELNSVGNLLGLKPSEVVSGSPKFKESLRKQMDIPDPTVWGATKELGKTFKEAAVNIPQSAGRLVKDVATAVVSPIETAKSIGGLALGLIEKLIPGEQESEKYADALFNNYKERFGTLQKATETFKEDPVGFLADTAGVLLAGGGALKGVGAVTKLKTLSTAGGTLVKTGMAIDPLMGVSKIGKPIAKTFIKSAEKGIEKVLAPTKEITKAKTKKILPQLTKEQIKAFTTESFQKQIKERLAGVGKEFDIFLSEKGIKGVTKIKKLTDIMEEAKGNFKVGNVIVEPKSIKIIEGLQETLKRFGESIPNTELRNLRQIWDKTVAKGKRFDIAKTSEILDEIDFKKMLTDSIRGELAKTNPVLAEINKKFTFYKNVDDILSETVRRKRGQAGGLSKKLAFIAGLATGEGVIGKIASATALSTFVKTIESTAWKTVTSSLKIKLAKALTSGNKMLIADVLRQIEKSKED